MTFDSAPKIWRKASLSDCCKIISGATPRRDNPEYWGGTIPWVTPKDLSKLEGPIIEDAPEYITEKGYRSCSTDLLPKGSVLFSSRAPIGHVAIAGRPMCTNQGFKSLIPGDDLDSSYLYWCLRKLVPEISARGTGTTFKEVSKAVMEEFEIPLPPLPEQKRIATILDNADSIRRKRQEAVRLTEELLSSTFLDMFGDPEANPKGVKVVHLSEITTRITDGVHQKPNYTVSGVPFISVKDITTGTLKFDSCKFVSPEDHQIFTKRCKAEHLDILYTKVGATYGRPAVVDTNREFSLYVSVCLIKPQRNLVDSYYLNAVLGTKAIKRQADKRIKGIGVPDLHLDQIQQLLIPLPAMDEQREFARRVAVIEKLRSSHIDALTELDNLFSSLLQRAFNGDL